MFACLLVVCYFEKCMATKPSSEFVCGKRERVFPKTLCRSNRTSAERRVIIQYEVLSTNDKRTFSSNLVFCCRWMKKFALMNVNVYVWTRSKR